MPELYQDSASGTASGTGGNGETTIYTIDVDTSQNILAGGSSNDTSIVSGSKTSIAFYYSSAGSIVWRKQFTDDSDYVSEIKFYDSAKLVLVTSSWGSSPTVSIRLVLMQLSNGAVLSTVEDPNAIHWAISTFDALVIGPGSSVTLAYQDVNDQFYLTSFSVGASSIVQTTEYSFPPASWYPSATEVGQGLLYIGGYQSSLITLTVMRFSDFAHYFHIKSSIGSASYNIQKMSYVQDSTNQYVFACLGGTKFGLIRFDVTNAQLYSGNVTQQYFSDLTSSYCADVKSTSITTAISMIQVLGTGKIYIVDMNVATGSFKYQLLNMFSHTSNRVWDAEIVSSSLIFFGGMFKVFQGLTTMTYNAGQTLLSVWKSTDTGTLGISTITTTTLTSSTGSFSAYVQARGGGGHAYDVFTYSQSNLLSTNAKDLTPNFSPILIDMTPPTPVTNYVYNIFSTAMSFTVPSYLVTDCNDAVITTSYTVTPAFPASTVTFNGAYTFTVVSNTPSHAGVYTITFTQKLQVNQQASQSFTLTYVNPCITATLTKIAESDQVYGIGSGITYYPINVFTSAFTTAQCGAITYTAVDENGSALDSSIFNFDSSTMKLRVSSNLPSQANVYHIYIVAKQGSYTGTITSNDFDVTLQLSCGATVISTTAISDYTYKLKDSILYIPLTVFTESKGYCGPFVYTSYINGVLQLTNNYITFDTTNSRVWVYAYQSSAIRTHTITIRGTLPLGLWSEISFQVTILPNNLEPPLFQKSLQALYVVEIPNRKVFTLPDIEDFDNDNYTVSYKLHEARQFIVVDYPYMAIQAQQQFLGMHTIEITLTDNNPVPLSFTYTLLIQIKEDEKKQIIINDDFDNSKFQYDLDLYDKLKNKKLNNTLNATITYISMTGDVQVKFSQQILSYDNLTNLYESKGIILELQNKNSKSTNRVTNYNIQSIDGQYMWLKVYFKEPLAVSIEQEYDNLYLYFNVSEYFVTKNLDKTIKQNYTTYLQIPPQLPDDGSTKSLKSFGETASNTLFGSFVLNFIFALVLGFSLKQLWMLLNTLQILCCLPLLNISIPSNYVYFAQMLKDISNLNFLPKEQMKKLTGIFGGNSNSGTNDENDKFVNARFKTMGYQSTNIQQNLGLLFFVLLAFAIVAVFIIIMQKAIRKYPKAKRFFDNIKQKIFYNLFIRSGMKGYLNFSLALFIQMQADTDDVASMILTVLMALFIFSAPITTFIFLLKNLDKLKDDQFRVQFGTLYLNLKETMVSALYPTMFLTRRLIFSASISFLGGYSTFQLILQVLISFILLESLLFYKPIGHRNTFLLEITNEFTLLCSSYLLVIFTKNEFEENQMQMRYNIGWYLVALVTFNIAMNWINLIYFNVIGIRNMIRKYKMNQNKLVTQKYMNLTNLSDSPTNLDISMVKPNYNPQETPNYHQYKPSYFLFNGNPPQKLFSDLNMNTNNFLTEMNQQNAPRDQQNLSQTKPYSTNNTSNNILKLKPTGMYSLFKQQKNSMDANDLSGGYNKKHPQMMVQDIDSAFEDLFLEDNDYRRRNTDAKTTLPPSSPQNKNSAKKTNKKKKKSKQSNKNVNSNKQKQSPQSKFTKIQI
eukprot:403354921